MTGVSISESISFYILYVRQGYFLYQYHLFATSSGIIVVGTSGVVGTLKMTCNKLFPHYSSLRKCRPVLLEKAFSGCKTTCAPEFFSNNITSFSPNISPFHQQSKRCHQILHNDHETIILINFNLH